MTKFTLDSSCSERIHKSTSGTTVQANVDTGSFCFLVR